MNALKKYDDAVRRREGAGLIGGVDEAGRGALAGPVLAAVVVLDGRTDLEGVNDSKALRPAAREAMVPKILAGATSCGVGLATAEEIDEVNVLRATHLAAGRALATLRHPPEFLITDYLNLRGAPCPILAIKKGDATSLAVAAASVLAKVARDRIMTLLDAEFPQYGFAAHKGYGTARHLEALREFGPSTLHRLTFAGVSWFDAEPEVVSLTSERGALPPAGPPAQPRTDLLDLLRGELDPAETPAEAPAFLPDREYARPMSMSE